MNLDFSGKVVFAKFLHCKVTSFPFLPLFFGNESLIQPTLKGEERFDVYPQEGTVSIYVI